MKRLGWHTRAVCVCVCMSACLSVRVSPLVYYTLILIDGHKFAYPCGGTALEWGVFPYISMLNDIVEKFSSGGVFQKHEDLRWGTHYRVSAKNKDYIIRRKIMTL